MKLTSYYTVSQGKQGHVLIVDPWLLIQETPKRRRFEERGHKEVKTIDETDLDVIAIRKKE